MRIAVVSDIHGNRTAFEAVLADLQQTAPDAIFHGGDLSDAGSGSIEIVDQIRSLGSKGVAGNTDQMLALPETFESFANRSPKLASLWDVLREMAAATRELLGKERLDWLRNLPLIHVHDPIAIVHAIPGDTWSAPFSQASDEELVSPIFFTQPAHCYLRTHSSTFRSNCRKLNCSQLGERRTPLRWRSPCQLTSDRRFSSSDSSSGI
jgi:hypothetical protein